MQVLSQEAKEVIGQWYRQLKQQVATAGATVVVTVSEAMHTGDCEQGSRGGL